MIFQVVLTEDASKDLEELYEYIASHDAPSKRIGFRRLVVLIGQKI